jgi:hypothetical protein
MLMSAWHHWRGQCLLTSAALTVNGQGGRWVPLVSLTPRLTGGALSQAGQKKKEKGSVWIWAQRVLGQLKAQPGSAPWVSSAWSSAGRLGPWAGWACRPAQLNKPAHGPLLSPSLWQNGPRGQRPSLSPTGRAHLSVTHRICCGRQWCVCACVDAVHVRSRD